jgi:hypothetical protein
MKLKHLLLLWSLLFFLNSCGGSSVQYDEEGNEIIEENEENSENIDEVSSNQDEVETDAQQVLENTEATEVEKTEAQLQVEEAKRQKQIKKRLHKNQGLDMLQAVLLHERLMDMSQFSKFKEDEYLNYYGNPLLIINIKSEERLKIEEEKNLAVKQIDEEALLKQKLLNPQQEGEQFTDFTDLGFKNVTNPELYNDLGVDSSKYLKDYNNVDSNFEFVYKKNMKEEVKLEEKHITLLNQLVVVGAKNEKSVVLIYMSGVKLNNEDNNTDLMYKKSVYTQYISNYLYGKLPQVLIEKRFVNEIPEDEVMILLYKYDGDVPSNIYNVKSTNSLEWLEQFKKLEKQRSEDAIKRNIEIEKALKEASFLAGADSKNTKKKTNPNTKNQPQVKKS